MESRMIRPMVIDLETSIGAGPHGPDAKDPSNDIYTFIYGNHPERITINHSSVGFKRKIPENMAKILAESDYIVGHNLGFDLGYVWHTPEIKQFLTNGGKVWDTQVAEYILTAQQHQYASLAELQAKYLGGKQKLDRISGLYKKGIGADHIVKNQHRIPRLFKLYEEYCKLDGSTTLQVMKAQYIRAKQEGMLDIIMLYQDYLLAIINMQCSGIHIDVPACERTLTEFNIKHLEYLEQAQELIKPLWSNTRLPTFNINSPDHKSAILFGGEVKNMVRTNVGKFKNGKDKFANVEHKIWVDGFQIPKILTTETKKQGVYVTDVNVMTKIEEQTKNAKLKKYCELQREAMAYKKAAKTYVQAFLELSVDGKLYTNLNNTATTTGRLSSSKPNLQNVSKRNKFGKTLHKLFIAPPGWKCVQVDFSQLEIFVLAWLSGDETLREHLLTGIDMHCVRLGYYNDKSYDELVRLCKTEAVDEWVKARSAAKTVSYQMAYGAQPKKVSESTGLDLDIVETIFAKEAETYPDTFKLAEAVQESIKATMAFSLDKNIPGSQKRGINGHRTINGIELLPIFDKSGNVYYTNEYRKVGYWQSPTKKKYHFLQTGNVRQGKMQKSFSFTQPKNFPMQGSAADIQGATTAALLMLLLKHPDKIQMINEVHDSKWFYIKEEYVDKIIPKLREIIEDVPKIFKERFNIDVPFKFPIDIEIGDNFAEMDKYCKPEEK